MSDGSRSSPPPVAALTNDRLSLRNTGVAIVSTHPLPEPCTRPELGITRNKTYATLRLASKQTIARKQISWTARCLADGRIEM
jgi:hypothetical protein